MNLVENKNEFLTLAKKYIRRDGIEKLLAYLDRSDFFVCPATTAYNLSVEGGLCQHSLNTFKTLIKHYYGKPLEELTNEDEARTFEGDMTIESIAIVGLLASICKVDCYVKDFKNVKVNGRWEQQEYWRWDEKFIYPGRGSKSVYILQQYLRLYVEEAQAISFYLAGEDNLFAGVVDTTYRKVYEHSRLALYLHLSEMESTYLTDLLDNG